MTTSLRTITGRHVILDRREAPMFFGRILRRILDGTTEHETLRQLPADFPLRILGQDTWVIKNGHMYIHSNSIDTCRGGAALETLLLRLQTIRAESEVFLIQKEIAI